MSGYGLLKNKLLNPDKVRIRELKWELKKCYETIKELSLDKNELEGEIFLMKREINSLKKHWTIDKEKIKQLKEELIICRKTIMELSIKD
jgi:uncharacterized coiled-coil DUF342 family protein